MFRRILSFIMLGSEEKPKEVGCGFSPRLAHRDFQFIRKVVDSSKHEDQIAVAIDWIHRMYRRGFFESAIYQELIHHAQYKEEELIRININKNLILPHLKKRADEIADEERRKKIRLVKTEAN